MSGGDAEAREERRRAREAARRARGLDPPAPAAPVARPAPAADPPAPAAEWPSAGAPPAETRARSAGRDLGPWRAAALGVAVLIVAGVVVALALGRGHDDPQRPRTTTAATGGTAPARARTPRASGTPSATLPSAAQQQAGLTRLAALGLPVYCGGHHGNLVALTFDDGPGPYSHYVVKRLRRNHMRATWFLVSRNLPTYGAIVPEERKYGAIADHTETHPNLPSLSPDAQAREILGARDALARAIGGAPVDVFRPPYGSRNAGIDKIAQEHGLVEVVWDVDSADSAGANYAGIRRNVIGGLHAGAIILMHDNRGQTVRALPPILHALARKHFRAVTLPELLTADPPTLAQLRRGPAGCRASTAVAPVGV